MIMLLASTELEYLMQFLRFNKDLMEDSSVILRLMLWKDAFDLAYHSYFIGNGINSFKYLTNIWIWGNFGYGTELYKTHANSFFLEHLADEGILYVIFVYMLFYKYIYRHFKSNFFTFISSFTILITSFYDDLLHDPIAISNIIFAIVLTLKIINLR